MAVPTGRIARLGRLGTMTAGVAGNMAMGSLAQLARGQRPSLPNLLLNPKNITRVADQLATMRGAAMKIGQLMSMDSGDILPPELAQILARLRNNAHVMPPAQLKKVLKDQWPAKWLGHFQKFDVHPIAAASIGQVHRAQLKDGRDLAIKVQYPGVANSIDSDVANVGGLMRMSGLLPKGFDIAPYLEEGRKQLHEETDYVREGARLAQFGELLSTEPQFVVPALHKDWSTSDILAMTYVAGTPIEDTINETQQVRDRIATQLIELTLKELFVFGVMQTDPNFANYLYKPETQQIVLLDFGATRTLDPVIVDQYRKLMQAGLSDNTAALKQIIGDIGFIAPDTKDSHQMQIIEMIRIVFGALRKGQPIDFANTDLAQQIQRSGLALAEDGFMPPLLPIDVLLLQRKFAGVFLLAARLKAKVEIATLAQKYLP